MTKDECWKIMVVYGQRMEKSGEKREFLGCFNVVERYREISGNWEFEG